MSRKTSKPLKPATIAARAGVDEDPRYGAVMPPIYASTNYTFDGYNNIREYDYSRAGNPTRDVLGRTLAELDGGAGCTVTSTGMSAIDLVLQLVNPGDLVLAPHDCYGGTFRLLKAKSDRGLFNLHWVNQTDEKELEKAFARKPKLVMVETPSNPLMRITDIAKVCEMAQKCGAIVAVDNTFLSPVCQRPLELGADLVIHSCTKYINGHSDVVSGAVVAKTQEHADLMKWWANCNGITSGAWDSYLTMRGLRTLQVRIRRQQETTARLVEFLNAHTGVKHVNYPGLPDHPGHDIAARQQHGFGPMLSFELDGGENAVREFLAGLELFSLAESLGGVESLIAHPATMTHAAVDKASQEKAGITVGTLRISPGMEDAQDLIDDLDQALARAQKSLAA